MVDCKECKNYNICEIRKMVEGKLKHCQSYEQKKPQTNADRIRVMSNEKMAEFFVELIEDAKSCDYSVNAEEWLEWLESKVEVN